MNRVFLVGRTCKDVDYSTTASGISVGKFSIAVDRRYNKDGEKETDFFNIVTFKGQADNCNKYLKKGNKVGIVGTIQNRSYDDKDGVKRYITEIIADEVEFLTPKKEEEKTESVPPKEEKKPKAEMKPIEPDDSLPF